MRTRLIASVFWLSAFISIVDVSSLKAEVFRQFGNELIEAAVMEADAVVDVYQISLSSGVVKEVLYGYDLLGVDITKGSEIGIAELPNFQVPLFDSHDFDARFLERVEKDREVNHVRGLYFIQRKMKSAVEHYGSLNEFRLPEHPSDYNSLREAFRPKVVLGHSAYGWWINASDHSLDEDVWLTRKKWPTFGVIEELLRGKSRPTRLSSHTNMWQLSETAARYRTRRYLLDDNADTWKELLVRVRKAADVRKKFDFAKSEMSKEEKVEFYLKFVGQEKVYANYALEQLRDLGGKEVFVALKSQISNLKIYSDDALLTLSSILFKNKAPSTTRALEGFVDVAQRFTKKQCLTAGSFKTASERLGSAVDDKVLGTLDAGVLMPLLSRLYQAEFRCFLIENDINVDKLRVPDYPEVSYEKFLKEPKNSGLTLDEVGLLGKVEYSKVLDLRKRQESILDFKPVYTWKALENISLMPTGLKELVNYCKFGVDNYDEVAMPDLTQSSYVVWKFSCDLLSEFIWPNDECPINDLRLLGEVSDYSEFLVKAIQVAIENDDFGLMHFAFDIFAKNHTGDNAALVSSLITLTAVHYNKPIRKEFLLRLIELPYYSVASALSKEYYSSTKKHRDEIDSLLKTLTRAEPFSEYNSSRHDQIRDWESYLRRLRKKRDSDHFLLFYKEGLRQILHNKSCEDIDWGWSGRWKEVSQAL